MPRLMASGPAAWRGACALTLLALLLNVHTLGSRSIVHDEAGSILNARRTVASLVPVLTGDDPNMGLYYVLLHFWVTVCGESEAAARSLSAVFAALAVPTLYFIGERLFGRTAGLVAGLLLALNAFIIKYAQLTRSYALLVFLVTLSSYCFVVELEQPSKRTRIGYLLASTLAIYAHYFAAYVLIAHVITLVAVRRGAAFSREWLGLAAMILLLCAPEAIFAYRGGVGRISWIEPPSLNEIGSVFVDLAGGSQILLVLLLVGGSYATMSAVRERRSWPYGFLAAWLLVPVVLSFAVSFVQPMFLSNYLIICVPALILFGAAAIVRIHRPALAGALVILLVSLAASRLVNYYRHNTVENWREATRYVLAAASPGDGIVFYSSENPGADESPRAAA
jgi:mannosyltransferase